MAGKITRQTFISPDHAKVAATQGDMYNVTPEGVKKVAVPDSVRESGSIPDGYAVDFVLDPATVVSALKKAGYHNQEQLPPEVIEKVKEMINEPGNLKIIPNEIHAQKRAAEIQVFGE
ncbi:hypothetical protein M413DRAFT_7786 [Hebeloma cylindrosporum]|uniref:Uncharacterized protein n=1 Tax=Hebeloma cylindrosporum TaxID=76867 RepID=A0A0C2YBL9_HEBCY|nr:hypothetical protein M413DRAFT_7786 [Hebeloma cylindrosporum h7]